MSKKSNKNENNDSKSIEITSIEIVSEDVKKNEASGKKDFDGHIKEVIDDALDENVEALIPEEQKTVPDIVIIDTKRILTAVLGFLMIVFSVFGVIATIDKAAEYVKSQSDDTKLISYFEKLVTPLSVFDATVFDSIENLSSDVIITAACWDIVLYPSATFAEEDGVYQISYLDVETRIAKLFGTGLDYEHHSVGDSELTFEYDEETKMYSIPAYPRVVSYLPVLESYEKTEQGYTLKVNYIYPISTVISAKQNAEKVMIIKVVPNAVGYSIASLELYELKTGQDL